MHFKRNRSTRATEADQYQSLLLLNELWRVVVSISKIVISRSGTRKRIKSYSFSNVTKSPGTWRRSKQSRRMAVTSYNSSKGPRETWKAVDYSSEASKAVKYQSFVLLKEWEKVILPFPKNPFRRRTRKKYVVLPGPEG